ncbi:MAG: hypothetical protein IPL96_17655 [Holophagaceae bacterium]|nr:hypothetical protein [Holophagaceae bacterium]
MRGGGPPRRRRDAEAARAAGHPRSLLLPRRGLRGRPPRPDDLQGGRLVPGPEGLDLVFEGNRFLMHQVRIMAGTLVEVGRGRREAGPCAGWWTRRTAPWPGTHGAASSRALPGGGVVPGALGRRRAQSLAGADPRAGGGGPRRPGSGGGSSCYAGPNPPDRPWNPPAPWSLNPSRFPSTTTAPAAPSGAAGTTGTGSSRGRLLGFAFIAIPVVARTKLHRIPSVPHGAVLAFPAVLLALRPRRPRLPARQHRDPAPRRGRSCWWRWGRGPPSPWSTSAVQSRPGSSRSWWSASRPTPSRARAGRWRCFWAPPRPTSAWSCSPQARRGVRCPGPPPWPTRWSSSWGAASS